MTGVDLSADRSRRALARVLDTSDLEESRLRRAYAAGIWSCLVEPGDATAGRLIEALGADDALEWVSAASGHVDMAHRIETTPDDLRDALARWRPRLEQDVADAAFADAARAGVVLLTPDDPRWPRGAADLGWHGPVCLWVRGDPAALSMAVPGLAVVGARAATGYGEHVAMEIAAALAGRGATIVSGAAYGIDGAAHRAALSVGGTTVALLAGGVDRPYPAGHSRLLDDIARSGAVASEVPCRSAPTKWRFLQRNRLIAAMSSATVVVEAGWRSGSLNTAGHAASLGRPLGAVPGPVTSAASAGCHRMLREFDARCITGPDDAAELMGVGREQPALFDDPLELEAHTDDRTRVADALTSRASRGLDDIARRSGMAPAAVQTHLGMMQLTGDAEFDGSGWRRSTAQGH
jgi:DNA processing protein